MTTMTKAELVKALQASSVPDDQPIFAFSDTKRFAITELFEDGDLMLDEN